MDNGVAVVDVVELTNEGVGIALHDGQRIEIFGAFPGEQVKVKVRNSPKKGLRGDLREILVAHPKRIPAQEAHALASAPWQVIPYEVQREYKTKMMNDLFREWSKGDAVSVIAGDAHTNYRTKMEYCVTDREVPLSLAFHERGGSSYRIPAPNGSQLAGDRSNHVALEIVKRLREAGYVSREIKSLIVRESRSTGNVVVQLFLKDPTYRTITVSDISNLSGFLVLYSTPKSPASVVTSVLHQEGELQLHERVLGLDIEYSYDSFFQNNIPVFEQALKYMQAAVRAEDRVLELYAGVGTIGLFLAAQVKEVHGVEVTPGAVLSMQQNSVANSIENYSGECLRAETFPAESYGQYSVVVVDPPRSGLHPDILRFLHDHPRDRILYLSCNPVTQVRDIRALQSNYQVTQVVGFDFYPQTPHLESLVVLEKVGRLKN